MFDFLRNLTKSAEEKRQEAVAAYLDGALSSRARQQFEQEMVQDEALRQEVEQLRLIKQSLGQLPQREVPRNFILAPAAYGRPARQPWVQAYPVLRAATAMTAFFLIFALATGVFTNQGAGESATFAPAADVAQVEDSAAGDSDVVTEETEPRAFEAEEAAVEAEEPAVEPAAEEEAMEEEAMDEAALVEEEAEEMAADEEMAEEETAEEAEAPPVPAATAVPSSTDALQEDIAEDGALGYNTLVAPTPTPVPTTTISPTPTVSTLPRVTPPTPLPDRDMDQAEGDNAADGAVADVPASEDEPEPAEPTAVLSEDIVHVTPARQPFDPLLVLQIGLGVLLLLLAGFTLYARRQR